MTIAIHQLLPTLRREDAIGNYALNLRSFFRGKGFDSSIFVYRREAHDHDALPWTAHRKASSKDNIALLHTAVASPLDEYFRRLPDKKVLVYHNITPGEYLVHTDPLGARSAWLARRVLRSLAPAVQAAVADSFFNARELSALGFPSPSVIPLIFDWTRLEGEADEELLLRLGDGKTNILFVGKLAPNKKQEDAIKVFYRYHRSWNPDSRLILVGDYSGDPAYARSLFTLVERLDLNDVVFAGKVTPEELRACYHRAHIFLSLSEHEGFGVPLVESLFYRVPVLAYAATAVPETLGGAGIVFSEKNPEEIACLLHRIVSDHALKERVLKTQDERLRFFHNFDYRSAWDAVLAPLLR
jgi:glycosyltransferase involved in cell wall biosynthesis